MKLRFLLAAIACALAATPAQAALTLCNRTSYILYAATSAIQSPRSQTQGWTRITPGECQLARKKPLTAETYLVHARTSLAHSGPARAWGGAYPVCVKDANFSSAQGVTQPYCTAEDTFALPFAPLDNRGKSVWTMNFDEQPAMNATEAQLAGVKRLLKDNGYKIDRIDGKPDKATGAGLQDFRKRMKFAVTAGNTQLFDTLEREARKKIAPAGYTACNETRDVLLLALGQIEGGRPVSRGWWTVQPGACAKAVTTPLNTDAVYLLALRKSGGTLVGGGIHFCTTAAAFEIKGANNCSGRGLAYNGFAATPTKGASGYFAHIGPAGLKR
ncbi:MAG: DUF1036 domain-containing protein [Alphaproteobacteria bacterium]|nr:DUF1036 domain-containing protein [Alphaproteobacteria bacterium]